MQFYKGCLVAAFLGAIFVGVFALTLVLLIGV